MEDWPKHVHTFCQIFGGFPLKFIAGRHGKKTFCTSPTNYLWSVTLVSFQFVTSLIWVYNWYVMHKMGTRDFVNDHKLFNVLVLINGISVTTVVLVLFFSYNRKHLRFVRIHDVLDMFKRNHKLTTLSAKTTMEMVAACIVVTFFLSITIQLRIIHFQKASVGLQEYLATSILYTCMVSMAWAQGVFFVHFSHIMQNIAAGFMILTCKIEQVVVGNNSRSLIPYVIPVSEYSRGGYTATGRIRPLIRDYWLLCDTVREANAFYSDQLLAVVLTTFLRTVNSLSAFVIYYSQGNITATINSGIWSLTLISFMFLIANLSTNVTESAGEMVHSICRLTNMDIDEELREQLEEFWLQLIKHKVEISACGFFNINYQTVISMAGAITTYMVILIQLETSP